MNLLYFGTTGRQLFGAYHAPPATVAARGAALLCPPWGQEYLVSHRIFRRLAVRLSESGYHVLRFDYYGTGDSAGGREEGDLDSWLEDAQLAAEELRDMSGYGSFACFGIRLGAVIASRLAAREAEVHTTVLWDPVVNGERYLKEMQTAQLEIERWAVNPMRRTKPTDPVQDLLGFPLTQQMRRSIAAVQPQSFIAPSKAHLKVFYSDESPAQQELHQALHAAGAAFHAETILGQTPWREDERMGAGALPVLVLERMVEILR